MELTPLGIRLLPRVAAAMAELYGLFGRRSDFDPLTTTRTVVVGASDYAAFVVLPWVLPGLATAAPGLRLIVRNTSATCGLAMLEAGEAEILWGVFPDPPQRVRAEELFHEEFLVAARRGHPALDQGRLTVEAYAAADHANVSLRRESGGFIDAALEEQGVRRRIVLTLGHFLMAAHVLAGTDLIVTEPRRLLAPLVERLDLVSAVPPVRVPGFAVSQVWHMRSSGDPVLDWLREGIAAAMSPKS